MTHATPSEDAATQAQTEEVCAPSVARRQKGTVLTEEQKESRRAYAKEHYRRKCALRESNKDTTADAGD